MFKLVVVSALVACACAAVQSGNPHVGILRQVAELNPDGSYQWSYETENGINAQEQGQLKKIGQESGIEAQGSYQYTAPDGTPISTHYIANEGGFQPQGAHLPVDHPIPHYIIRALEYNAAHPYVEEHHHQQKKHF